MTFWLELLKTQYNQLLSKAALQLSKQKNIDVVMYHQNNGSGGACKTRQVPGDPRGSPCSNHPLLYQNKAQTASFWREEIWLIIQVIRVMQYFEFQMCIKPRTYFIFWASSSLISTLVTARGNSLVSGDTSTPNKFLKAVNAPVATRTFLARIRLP